MPPAMRPLAHVFAFFSTLALASSLFAAACSTGSSPPEDASGAPAQGTSAAVADAPRGDAPPSASEAAGGPHTGEPLTEVANPAPSGGVVMNNGTAPGGAGTSDRTQGIIDAVTAARDRYRACFDAWAKKAAPADETQITLTIKVKEGGETDSAGFKADETDITDKGVEGCMLDVTKSLKFPPSPKGMVTTYNHRFKFKKRK
jgi:hypothetical protein